MIRIIKRVRRLSNPSSTLILPLLSKRRSDSGFIECILIVKLGWLEMLSKINNSCFFRKFTPIVFFSASTNGYWGLTILPLTIKPHLDIITPFPVIPRFFPHTVFLSERHPWIVLPCYLFKEVALTVPFSLLRVPPVGLDLPGRAVEVGFASFVAIRSCIFPAHFFGKCGTAPWPLTGPSSVSENRVRHHAS